MAQARRDRDSTHTRPRAGPSLACALAAAALVAVAVAVHAAEPDLSVTPLMRDGQLLVTIDLAGGLTAEVRDAIQSGLPTTFSYDVDLRRGSAAWFDRTIASLTISATVRFDNLTRRYQMSRMVDGRAEDAPPTGDREVMGRWMTHFERVPLSATSSLEANGEYYVRVRAHTRPRNSWFVWPWDRIAALGRANFTFIQ